MQLIMTYRINCPEARQQLQSITSLERELDQCFIHISQAANTRTFQEYQAQAIKIKQKLEESITLLVERANPFERLFNLQDQYRKQINVLETANILEERYIQGEMIRGFVDINGNFQKLPTLREVVGRLREKKELLERKHAEGFGTIRLVPFGMSLDDLAQKYGQVIIQQARDGKLFRDRKNRKYPKRISVQLDFDDALFISDVYTNADIKGDIVYDVTKFDPDNHGGKTKSEILKERKEQHKSAWDIIVLENKADIPKLGQAKPTEGKKQKDNTPEDYLNVLKAEPYEGEVGLTPEEILIHAITHIIERKGSLYTPERGESDVYTLGAYLPMKGVPSWAASGLIPHFSFYSVMNNQRASLSNRNLMNCLNPRGLQSGVRV